MLQTPDVRSKRQKRSGEEKSDSGTGEKAPWAKPTDVQRAIRWAVSFTTAE